MLAALLAFLFMQTQPAATPSDPANVLESVGAQNDWEPNADPQSEEWMGIAGVLAAKGFFGQAIPLKPTEIRSRWTNKNLYLLFVCPYNELHLKPNPDTTKETNKLWEWDVAEAFIGSDYLKTSQYKEFQVSPQSEYVDLEINQDDVRRQKGVEWQSGFVVKGRIDAARKVWFGEMRIPFASLGVKGPKTGGEMRIGLFRIEGREPRRIFVTWRATNATTFHVPAAFGSLVLR